MTRLLVGAATCAIVLASSLPALALTTRTWISGKGVDQAGCGPIATPCRTLQYAHDNTAASGEIDVLDSAGYGPLVITKSISVVNDGNVAGVLSSGNGSAIAISAGSGDQIVLSGLTIEGAGTGSYGIRFDSGGTLTVSRCLIQQFTSTAIYISPPSGTVGITILDTIVTNNSSGVGYAVSSNGSASPRIFLSRVTAVNNSNYGVIVNGVGAGNATIEISDSNIVGNAAGGLYFNQPNGAGTIAGSIDRSTIASNVTGLVAFKGTLRLNQNTFIGNGSLAITVSPNAVVTTLNNNNISGTISGTLTPGTLQ